MIRPPDRCLVVYLGSKRVGSLFSYENVSWFKFEKDYLSDPDRPVLGLRFEDDLSAKIRSNLKLPAWFSNLLPEGKLREWVASSRHISEVREYDLLRELGSDLPGAVVVSEEPVTTPLLLPPSCESIAPVAGLSSPSTNNWHFSLAGVAMKFSLLRQGERFTAPGKGQGGDWIIKLPDSLFPNVPINEFSMMRLASLVGIEVPEVRLISKSQLVDIPIVSWPETEPWAYAVRRFDRLPGGERIHMEDLAQVRGFYPHEKYKGSFETVGALIYRNRHRESLVQFVRRLAFNLAIENGDAHLKNWSLIYQDPRIPILSPAYDIVSTSVYLPESHEEDFGLTFGQSRRFSNVNISTFSRLQEKLGVEDVDIPGEVKTVFEKVESFWPKVSPCFSDAPSLCEKIGRIILKRKSLFFK